jgi:DNA modification methylase
MIRKEVIGGCELYLGDCREILPTLGPVDAVVTDPPYGNGALDGGKIVRASRSYDPLVRGHIWPDLPGNDLPFEPDHLLSIAHRQIIWGANNFASRLPDSACWLSWDRKTGRAADSNIGDCELAWVRGVSYKTIRAFRHMWAGFQRDSEVGHQHLHPTQKPVALMEWCLGFFPDAQTIVDPYMGSGPTGAACVRQGRSFIGIEIDAAHFDTACRRIEASTRQPDLFISQPKAPEQLSLMEPAE